MVFLLSSLKLRRTHLGDFFVIKAVHLVVECSSRNTYQVSNSPICHREPVSKHFSGIHQSNLSSRTRLETLFRYPSVQFVIESSSRNTFQVSISPICHREPVSKHFSGIHQSNLSSRTRLETLFRYPSVQFVIENPSRNTFQVSISPICHREPVSKHFSGILQFILSSRVRLETLFKHPVVHFVIESSSRNTFQVTSSPFCHRESISKHFSSILQFILSSRACLST